MDASRALTVGGMILVMCMLSSLLAMRRLVDADPAEIFLMASVELENLSQLLRTR